MNAQLLCRARGGANLTLKVPEGEAVLGRDNAAQVIVPLDGVSRRHARILFEGNAYWLQDLKSTNGTFLNGAPVVGDMRERLRHLDVIALGRDAELIFLLREKAPSAPALKKIILGAFLVLDEDGTEYKIGVGEVTLGRSTAANVAIDRAAISKLHARIQRSSDQLLLQDLNSANGTFVNGERVTTALLNDGDRLSLANVVSLQVKVEWGENTSASGATILLSSVAAPDKDAPEFKKDWKTRLAWDPAELAELEKLRKGVPPSEPATPAEKAAPKAATAKPAAPTVEKPAEKAAAPAPVSAKPAVPPPAKPAAEKPAASPPPAPKPAAPAPVPKAVEPPKPIAEVRLTGSGFDFPITDAGTYDLGRADAARLRIANATVSRNHARVIVPADKMSVKVEHVGKTTPTIVNGAPIAAPKELADGDTILLGEVSLTVKITRQK
jgi:pSer/pThr/pTyr-binding forkhead associated (FHA) protein